MPRVRSIIMIWPESIHFRTKCYIPHRCPTIMTVLLRDLKRVLEEYDGRGGRFFSTSGNLVGMKWVPSSDGRSPYIMSRLLLGNMREDDVIGNSSTFTLIRCHHTEHSKTWVNIFGRAYLPKDSITLVSYTTLVRLTQPPFGGLILRQRGPCIKHSIQMYKNLWTSRVVLIAIRSLCLDL